MGLCLGRWFRERVCGAVRGGRRSWRIGRLLRRRRIWSRRGSMGGGVLVGLAF